MFQVNRNLRKGIILLMNGKHSEKIMRRTRLRSEFFKDKTEENRRNYNKQQNYCVALLRKANKGYYGSLKEKHVTDNKTFWKTIKPLISAKTVNSPKITLVEMDETKKNEEKIAGTFNTFLTNIVSNLKIPPNRYTPSWHSDVVTTLSQRRC